MARPADPTMRIAILAAAEAEFVRHGIEATRVEDIVARAGRSKGAFYQHWASKDLIFRDIVESFLARLSLLVGKQLVDENNPPTRAEFVNRWLQRDIAIFEFVFANRDLVRLVLSGGWSVAFAGLMDAFAKHTYEVILESVIWCKEHRFYRRDFDSHIISVMIAGAYDRLARELMNTTSKEPNIRFMCAQAQDFLLRGIADR